MEYLRSPYGPASLERASQQVAACLVFDEPPDIPEDFEAFSREDFQRRIRLHPDLDWNDACRAYALGLATHASHAGRADSAADDDLEMQWDRLPSPPAAAWPVARMLIHETWRWLSR
ncbi:hypothetical protein [Pseudoxanthomonas sp. z9]|uniref:hypothetical protein n=1 Tax=Pseudoxanthomonas sp. z9 TaxID=2584942 RepID=UPI00114249D3|nr:hypothetical protein [Pseudoxanthomonas sp. z9]